MQKKENKYVTIGDIKEWIKEYEDNDAVYLSAFNPLCGGTFSLYGSLIDVKDDVVKTKCTPYISEYNINKWEDKDLLEHYKKNELLPSQLAQKQRDGIERSKCDWSDSKLQKELKILEELEKEKDENFVIGKKVPVIFINN